MKYHRAKDKPDNLRKLLLFPPVFFFAIHFSASDQAAHGGIWATYRHDETRSGITPESVPLPVGLRWVFVPTHAPSPAWPDPAEELPRTHFDTAYHVTADAKNIYFGSSVDNKIYALNADTGDVRWTFFTEGPVRFAPTLWENNVYVGSDDGYVYCLRSRDGKLVWKYRAGPSGEKVLGNGRMISLWPVRTSVIVDDGVIYFAAGVFPYEGVYICALDARDGGVVWKNDTIGDRTHELAFGGISPQGYLIASENILYVPSGRAMPAAFDRKTGEFLYYCSAGGKVGGTWALLDREQLIAGIDRSGDPAKIAYEAATGRRRGDAYAWFPGIDLVVTPDVAYALTEDGIHAIDRSRYPAINEELDSARKEREELAKMLSVLRAKTADADEKTRRELESLLTSIVDKIEDLGKKEEKYLKSMACKWSYIRRNLCSLVLAGDTLLSGGDNIIVAVDAESGQEVWREQIDGRAAGLAVANGYLLVSTENGTIYCFGQGEKPPARRVKANISGSAYETDKKESMYTQALERILSETNTRKGYCLVIGCETGRLALELAKRTDLKIIGIESDPKKLETARMKLDAAGIYGSRVVVESWDLADLPDYFANLVVSEEMLVSGKLPAAPSQIFRVLRPCGGVAILGVPRLSFVEISPTDLDNLMGLAEKPGDNKVDLLEEGGKWVKVTRGKLEGAGSWTELYGNPGNTACSDDLAVRCPLGVIWFGEPGPKNMIERHGRTVSPVSMDGRVFVQGEEVIMAYDAYNGTFLWQREIPGAVRVRVDVDGGNLALTEKALYVAAHNKCYALDPATGDTIREFRVVSPGGAGGRRWGYISCVGGILYGSAAMPLRSDYGAIWDTLTENGKWRDIKTISGGNLAYEDRLSRLLASYPDPNLEAWQAFHRSGALWRYMGDFPAWNSQRTPKGALTGRMMAGDLIFAVDAETGDLLWLYPGRRIANITLTLGGGSIFFADCSATEKQKAEALEERKRLIAEGRYEPGDEAGLGREDKDVRVVVALDAVTGEKLWEKAIDLTGCGGDKMGAAYQDGVLLFFGNFSNHDKGYFREGSLKFRRITALSAENGDVLWSRPLNYLRRPVVVGNTIIIEPRACDLRTGKIKMRSHPITGEQVPWEFLRPGHSCSITSAAPNLLTYRSYNFAFYDLVEDRGLTYFGAIRPGCWLSLIHANGLMMAPEASSGCTCSFPLRCSVAMTHKQRKRSRQWTVFITHGSMTPAKRLAINFGAPGDMMDDGGVLWFGYPRPRVGYGLKFDLRAKIVPGMGYFCRDFRGAGVEGSERPWLFTSGCLGLLRCEVPLIDENWELDPGYYTVRLGFMAGPGEAGSRRVFDVKLEGETVLENFDILKEAGGPNRAVVKEFRKVKVSGNLLVELVPRVPDPGMSEATLINFLEVVREDRVAVSEAEKPIDRLSEKRDPKTLIEMASFELNKGNYDTALAMYHAVLDRDAADPLKHQALEGLAAIGSPKSLSRIRKYCVAGSPILYNYKEPDVDFRKGALKVYVSIAENIAKTNKSKATRMLKYALTLTDDHEVRRLAADAMKSIGVQLETGI